jgi:hypothetical protein
MKYFLLIVTIFPLIFIGCRKDQPSSHVTPPRYIEVSKAHSSYFSFTDGTPYIPIGINLINPSGRFQQNPDSAFYEIDQWMKNLSENGGNYVRIWLSQSFWDMEEEMAGKYSDEKVRRIDRFFEMARKYNLKVKITLEHFRSVTLEENPQKWATKFAYHTSQGGPLDSIRQYITSEEGHFLFLDKVDFYKNRYGSDTLFFGWELWNEMNAMKGPEDSLFFAWNEKMLDEVKQRFPENLVMQSLGSFDDERIRPVYKKMMLLPGNEVAQVHRYLDLGAKMEVCHAPMDIISSSAIEELLSYNSGKPVILAETGAVEPRHAGPSKYYPLDTAGILLHDILFAPFFSGSAGAGMSWHWESYVHKNNLWYHFKRFHEAIKDINPIEENFMTAKNETDAVRVYVLKGEKNSLIWLRDKNSNWESELEKGIVPEILHEIQLNLHDLGIKDSLEKIEIYDPWKNVWTSVEKIDPVFSLPDFKRSIVVRVSLK